MNSRFIEFKNVSYTYESDGGNEIPRPVLSNINLTIAEGEFVAFVGHNGSGKSTLAKLINAIYLPGEGDVIIDGINTKDESRIFDIRRKAGLVFQNPDNQIVATIVEDDVAFGPENFGVPPQEIRARVDKALKDMGMYEFRLHEPHKLSGGQKQRVAIAGVLAMETQCIVFDEATAMLDPRGRNDVMNAIKKLNKEQKKTIIHITHFMEEAVSADRIIVLNNGEILLDGTPSEVFGNIDIIKKAGLDIPQVAEFRKALENENFDIGECLTAEECIEKLADRLKEFI